MYAAKKKKKMSVMSAALQLFISHISETWWGDFLCFLLLISTPPRELRAEINSSECLFLAQRGPLDVFSVFIKKELENQLV